MFRRIKEFFSKHRPGLTYGILRPCYRCVYQRSREPILIYSFSRGVRIVVNLDGKTYVRRGDCLGFKQCGECIKAITGELKDLPCKWNIL